MVLLRVRKRGRVVVVFVVVVVVNSHLSPPVTRNSFVLRDANVSYLNDIIIEGKMEVDLCSTPPALLYIHYAPSYC